MRKSIRSIVWALQRSVRDLMTWRQSPDSIAGGVSLPQAVLRARGWLLPAYPGE